MTSRRIAGRSYRTQMGRPLCIPWSWPNGSRAPSMAPSRWVTKWVMSRLVRRPLGLVLRRVGRERVPVEHLRGVLLARRLLRVRGRDPRLQQPPAVRVLHLENVEHPVEPPGPLLAAADSDPVHVEWPVPDLDRGGYPVFAVDRLQRLVLLAVLPADVDVAGPLGQLLPGGHRHPVQRRDQAAAVLLGPQDGTHPRVNAPGQPLRRDLLPPLRDGKRHAGQLVHEDVVGHAPQEGQVAAVVEWPGEHFLLDVLGALGRRGRRADARGGQRNQAESADGHVNARRVERVSNSVPLWLYPGRGGVSRPPLQYRCMTRTRLLLEGLRYHARGNLAVALGSAVGAAVLAGALLVGDSLRGSLRARTERQLNDTEHVLTGGRFFRELLAADLPGGVRPVILLQGTVRADGRRAGRVNVLGVDARYGLEHLTPTGNAATVSDALAKALDLKPGAALSVTVQKSSAIPRSSALARRDTTAATQILAVNADYILPPGHPAGEFTLSPGPATPLNLMVPLEALQKAFDQPGPVNTLLSSAQPLAPLQEALERHLTLDDWGIKVHVAPRRQKYISVESRRLILEPAAVSAALNTAEQTGCLAAKTFVYLANSIAANGAEIPYSVVAAVEPGHLAELNPAGEPFAANESILGGWKASPLKVKPGDQVTLTYFKPEVEGRVEEASKTFRLRSLIPLEASADDPDLVPEFPGITDRADIRNWDPPF